MRSSYWRARLPVAGPSKPVFAAPPMSRFFPASTSQRRSSHHIPKTSKTGRPRGCSKTARPRKRKAAEMRLILDIALTHILGRGRQTLVAVIGVAVGVGFSIAMAALMQGGQDDFVEQLIDTMPHVQVTDERRTPKRQPAE